MALIACENVSFAYENTIVVSGLNFVVNSGDYLCVAGENGSGKSTLIKGLLRLKQPSTGQIITGDNLKTNEIGYLPQQTPVQKDFPASVWEVVLSGCLNRHKLYPFYEKADKMAAEEHMVRFGVQDLRHQCYRELSGGQQQRVLLARALCATQKLLLLDEPVAGLDPLATQELYEQLEKINQESGLTIIMVSHDIRSAVRYAGTVLHLNKTQAFFGTVKDYVRSDLGVSFLGGEAV